MTFYYVALAGSLFLAAAAQASPSSASVLGPPHAPHDRRTAAQKILLGLSAAVLIVPAAVRWNVGTDYPTYAFYYERYLQTPVSEYLPWGEPGLPIIAKLGSVWRDDNAVMFAVAASLTLGLMLRSLFKETTYPTLALVVFVSVGAWLGPFNGVRQWLAAAVLVAAHTFVLQRRWRPYLLLVAVASMFHVTAAVLALVYFLPRRRLSPAQLALGGALVYVALRTYTELAEGFSLLRGDEASELLGSSYFSESLDPLRIAFAFVPVGLYWYYAAKGELSPQTHFYGNLVLVNALVLLSAAGSAYLARFSIYTAVYAAFLIPRLLSEGERRRSTSAVALAIGLIYLVFWYYDTTAQSALLDYEWLGDRP